MANLVVDAFRPEDPLITAIPNFAIIRYCGPRTWSGVSKCQGGKSKKAGEEVDTEKLCRVNMVQHFDEDARKTKNLLNGLSYQPGTKLVSLALLAAKAELTLGRK